MKIDRKAQAAALWKRADDLNRQFLQGDRKAGTRARATALQAAAIDRDLNGERQRLEIALRAKAPLRKPREQHDVDGLALFDQARQPTLF